MIAGLGEGGAQAGGDGTWQQSRACGSPFATCPDVLGSGSSSSLCGEVPQWQGRSGRHSRGVNGFPVVGEAPSKTLVETAKEATEKAKETALAATEKAKDLASKAATKKKQYV